MPKISFGELFLGFKLGHLGTYLAWRREKKIENYTIVNGDTLSAIALRFDVPMELIKDLNELKDNSIYAGKELKIPMDR